ncbi:MAG TPA: hypothetical protein VMT59_03520 [Gaiellaceae bacterium]|nr:hypothetical protein [Gaiellaceae bacterium]
MSHADRRDAFLTEDRDHVTATGAVAHFSSASLAEVASWISKVISGFDSRAIISVSHTSVAAHEGVTGASEPGHQRSGAQVVHHALVTIDLARMDSSAAYIALARGFVIDGKRREQGDLQPLEPSVRETSERSSA